MSGCFRRSEVAAGCGLRAHGSGVAGAKTVLYLSLCLSRMFHLSPGTKGSAVGALLKIQKYLYFTY